MKDPLFCVINLLVYIWTDTTFPKLLTFHSKYSTESTNSESPSTLLIEIILDILGPWCFHVDFKVNMSISTLTHIQSAEILNEFSFNL